MPLTGCLLMGFYGLRIRELFQLPPDPAMGEAFAIAN